MMAPREGHFRRHPLIHCFADCRAISTQVFGCLSHKKKTLLKTSLHTRYSREREPKCSATDADTSSPVECWGLQSPILHQQYKSKHRWDRHSTGNDIFSFVACWCRSCEIEQSQSSSLLLSLLRQVHNMPHATFRVEILLLVSCSCDVWIRVSVSFSIWFDNVFLSRWTTVSNVKLASIAIAMAVSMSSSEGSHQSSTLRHSQDDRGLTSDYTTFSSFLTSVRTSLVPYRHWHE